MFVSTGRKDKHQEYRFSGQLFGPNNNLHLNHGQKKNASDKERVLFYTDKHPFLTTVVFHNTEDFLTTPS